MSEKHKDKLPTVELVAVQRGFYSNRMIEPGQKFIFDPNPKEEGGKEIRRPKWAVEPDKAPAAKKKPNVAFDTKPVEAQAASKKKAAQLGGADLA